MVRSDLHAADAVYHAQCYSNFRTGKQKPKHIATTPEDNLKRKNVITTAGRPKSDNTENVFFELMTKIEDELMQKSIPELFPEIQTQSKLKHDSVVHMKKGSI